MRNTTAILDRARDLCSPPTDYQLAKRLGTTPQRVSNWRRRTSSPDNEAAFKIAKLLGMPVTDVIAYFEMDRAKDPDKRDFWDQQLPRVLASLAIACAALWALGDSLSGADTGVHAASVVALHNLYIMRNWIACGLGLGAILGAVHQSAPPARRG